MHELCVGKDAANHRRKECDAIVGLDVHKIAAGGLPHQLFAGAAKRLKIDIGKFVDLLEGKLGGSHQLRAGSVRNVATTGGLEDIANKSRATSTCGEKE